MATPSRELRIHGVRVTVPASWEDHTVFRFTAAAKPAPADFLKLGDKGTVVQRFRPNLIANAYHLKTAAPLAGIFEAQNQADARSHAEFKLLRHGTCRYLDQDAAWQDATFVDGRLDFQVFQRQIALMPEPARLVLFTLTCDAEADLAPLAREMGFDPPPAPADPP